jgi:hypothetical protein
MKFLVTIAMLFLLSVGAFAQRSGPFKPLPKVQFGSKLGDVPTTMNAWRFTTVAGYSYPSNQVVTGLGFTYQNLKWVDSTQKWYSNWSVGPYIFAGGNVVPSVNPFNIISVGVGVSVLNQLITLAPVYNLPMDGNGGKFGVVLSIGIALNN